MKMIIRNGEKSDIHDVAAVIRQSFASVAQRFNLTPENCPKHPSNCTDEWVERDMERGVTYFLMASGSEVVGCMALERANGQTCYLERLAVIPEKQNHGLGTMLFKHFLKEAAALGCDKIGIGIIAKQKELKGWYRKIGFVDVGTKTFAHLPFDVAFMEYAINSPSRHQDSGICPAASRQRKQ